jgi:glycosyltransferase involved in cell wall biosynthesis
MLVKDLLSARSRYVKNAWIALVERANLAFAAGIHVTSALERQELERFEFRLRGRVFEVPNGVVMQADLPTQEGSQSPYLLMLGRINWKKRIDIGLEALVLVDGVRLVIAGDDDDDLAATLRDRAASLGVGDRVEFVGHVETLRKRQLLHGALALLMPSVSENFGNSALEAMAEATPVIVTDQIGIAESVKDSGGGFVVAPTAAAFADAARQLHADPDLRIRMGERARAMTVKDFSWDVVGARMEAEYRSLVDAVPGNA